MDVPMKQHTCIYVVCLKKGEAVEILILREVTHCRPINR